jgi:hypothetical protein
MAVGFWFENQSKLTTAVAFFTFTETNLRNRYNISKVCKFTKFSYKKSLNTLHTGLQRYSYLRNIAASKISSSSKTESFCWEVLPF